MAGASYGQAPPVESQFQVNSYTPNAQLFPVVGADAQGGFVAAWESFASGAPGDSDIRARRFDPLGAPVGDDFVVNSYATGTQGSPAIAVEPGGGFLVVWSGDPGNQDVHARLYDAAGTPLGAQFRVNSYTTSAQGAPAVAAHGLDGFVVVWDSAGSSGSDSDDKSVQAQRFDGSGTPLGPQFQVNTVTTGAQSFPAVAADSQGNFVVVWASNAGAGQEIKGRRFDAGGVPLGGEFQVSTLTGAVSPAIAAGAAGDFVVAWENLLTYSIEAQRFDATGAQLGAEFQVNNAVGPTSPAVAADSAGDFVVSWQSYTSPGTDGSPFSVLARRYDAGGQALGDEFQVNTYTTGNQRFSSIASTPDGNFVVVWENPEISGQRFYYFALDVAVTGQGTLTSSPAGIACPSDCSETYPSSTLVTLTPAPAAGWVFTGWGGDCTGTGSCQVVVNAARSVTATFAPPHTLTVNVAGNGVVTSSPPGISCPADCSETYPSGTIVDLTPTPAPGWVFTGWGGDCSGTGNCQVVVDAARNVTATFMPPHTLTVSVGTGGSVTSSPAGISCPGDCTESYAYATQVALQASPDPLYHFVAWTGDCTGAGDCTVTMSADRSVGATFDSLPFLDGFETGNTSRWTVTHP